MGGIVTKRIALAIKVLLTGRKTSSKRDYSGAGRLACRPLLPIAFAQGSRVRSPVRAKLCKVRPGCGLDHELRGLVSFSDSVRSLLLAFGSWACSSARASR